MGYRLISQGSFSITSKGCLPSLLPLGPFLFLPPLSLPPGLTSPSVITPAAIITVRNLLNSGIGHRHVLRDTIWWSSSYHTLAVEDLLVLTLPEVLTRRRARPPPPQLEACVPKPLLACTPEPYRPLSRTYFTPGDVDFDEHNGEATLPEPLSPVSSTMPSGWRRPNPGHPSTESHFPLQQRELIQAASTFFFLFNDTDPSFLPGLNSLGNDSDIPTSLLGRDLHFPTSPPEPDSLLEEHSATEHSRSQAPSSGGNADRYNRGVAPPEFPPPTRSRVLESPKRDITSPESPSLHQDPTYAPYSPSPPSNPPISTLSLQSSPPPASIHTSRVSATETPNLAVTFTESESHGKSTNGIIGRCYNGWCCHQ